MGKREKRKWRPLLSPFFIVRPPGISLSPRLDGLAARPKTRGVTVFTRFLSIALRGVSAKYPSRCSSLDTGLDTVRHHGVSVASASL